MTTVQDPKQKAAIRVKIVEISNAWLQAEASNDLAKTIAADLAEEFELDKKLIIACARMYHKQNVAKLQEETDIKVDFYESFFGAN